MSGLSEAANTMVGAENLKRHGIRRVAGNGREDIADRALDVG